MRLIDTVPGHRLSALALGILLGTACSVSFGQSLERRPLAAADKEVEVFVRLSTPAVAELNAESVATAGRFAPSAAQRSQAARVDAEQAAIRPKLIAHGAEVLSRQRVGANGLRVRVRASEIDKIRALPGVRSVGRVEKHTLSNVDSVVSTGAPQVWETLGARGSGVTIAVIDSGVDYLHANMGGPGTPEAYAQNDKNVVEPGTFPNDKVIGGFDFAGATYDANVDGSDPMPDPDPLDGNGHGSHVAGSAAGLGVPGRIGPGVAPGAKLYALKVFNDTTGSTTLTSLAIEWAMDPNGDGDMSDHVDVINMSLGSAFGEPEDPSAITTANAVSLGIIVVTAAGNAGNFPYVVDSPSVAPGAISVAAAIPEGQRQGRPNVTAPAAVAGVKQSLEGSGPVKFRNGTVSGTLVEAVPLNGCDPLTNAAAVAGNIAFVQRGVCDFVVKYQNAQNAGARAIVVFNDGATPARVDPIVMGGITPAIDIPGLMISSTDGNAIDAFATTAADSPVQITIDAAPNPANADLIAGFSSRGPGSSGNSSFKPDLTAPGEGIVSTGVGTGFKGAGNQGTSMSSPHVAGAAAVLRELHPDLAPAGVKALLQNATVDANAGGDTSLARQGVGVLRVSNAAKLTSFATPGGISFGRLNPMTPTNVTESVTVRNLAGKGRTFSVTHVPQQTYPGVEVTCPSSVQVARNGSKSVKVRLKFDPGAAAAAGVADESSNSQTEVDGWCVLNDGTDTLRVGYLAVVDAASGMFVARGPAGIGVQVRNKGPADGVAEGFTLAGSGGEGASGTYSSIARLGYRTGDPDLFFGLPVIEFGISVERPWEAVSNLNVDLFLDLDRDGVDDVNLQARDLSAYDPDVDLGTYVTAQFLADGDGFLDWIVNTVDFNDRVIVLPFTLEGGDGLVSDSFNYRLVLQDRQGNTDVQTGSIDLADEIVPNLNSFFLGEGQVVSVGVTGGSGNMLWLFPGNNEGLKQDWVISTRAGIFR